VLSVLVMIRMIWMKDRDGMYDFNAMKACDICVFLREGLSMGWGHMVYTKSIYQV
jgi:hypothetical protein